MKRKWRNDRSSERNLCNCVKKPEKNSGLQRGLNPWPRDLPVRCPTNWAMKPLTLGAGRLWVHIFPWKKYVLMIYEINHIWTTGIKWKWRNDRSSERNLCNCVKKPEKKNFRTSTEFEPVYRCDALPTQLWSDVLVLHVLVIQSLCEVVKRRTEITPVLQSISPLILAINFLTCLFLWISAKGALIAILFLNNNSLWLLHLFQESHIKAVRERALPTVTQHLVREIVSPNQTIRQQVQNPIRLLYFKSRQTFFSLEQTSFKS